MENPLVAPPVHDADSLLELGPVLKRLNDDFEKHGTYVKLLSRNKEKEVDFRDVD